MIAAATFVYPWFSLLTALGNLFGIGGSSLVSRLIGVKRKDEVRYVSSFCFYSGITMTLLFSRVTFCLRFLGASAENMVFARTYLVWVVVLGGV